MKYVYYLTTISILLAFNLGCQKCTDENPKARVLNKGTGSVTLTLTSGNGGEVQFSDLASGSVSSSKTYPAGSLTVIYIIEEVEQTEVLNLASCTSYDITINSNNELVIFSQEIN
ncbi:hypothetical protein CW751_12780 [Brumimicrobium salinarum]|uniref:Uncharacterized protein n=1 Tax=Brumimicrobium salinarum TaxID=2058658 RepID=A0A2I0R028_9FLAO|nr:hypothetical protein [Brumimicrobium salinarum]PKR79951.1 hypothetical protein CW751_12780 [Brumimicrobium salinarum]